MLCWHVALRGYTAKLAALHHSPFQTDGTSAGWLHCHKKALKTMTLPRQTYPDLSTIQKEQEGVTPWAQR